MKLWITCTAHAVHPNALKVSSRRYSETAVSLSDFSIENFVIA